jgi:Na+/H+ antiporter NhaC
MTVSFVSTSIASTVDSARGCCFVGDFVFLLMFAFGLVDFRGDADGEVEIEEDADAVVVVFDCFFLLTLPPLLLLLLFFLGVTVFEVAFVGSVVC